MAIQLTTTSYGPSRELNERLNDLCQIAELSYNIGRKDLCKQAIEAHNKLASQYNLQASTKKKGFWGQFLDNLAFTTTNVTTIQYISESSICNNRWSIIPTAGQIELLNELLRKYR